MTEIDTNVADHEWLFITPQLPVPDVRAAQAYYRDVFGCRVAWTRNEEFGAVYSGRTEIYFAYEAGPIERACHFVRVANSDRVLEFLRERDATIVEAIASRPWGMREFTVEDLNGHRFRIGHSEGPALS
jgi:uncharacterized glyoxalase superfamily protein PhnB